MHIMPFTFTIFVISVSPFACSPTGQIFSTAAASFPATASAIGQPSFAPSPFAERGQAAFASASSCAGALCCEAFPATGQAVSSFAEISAPAAPFALPLRPSRQRSRSAFETTNTDEKLIAADPSMGDSLMPNAGYSAPAATGMPMQL